VSKALSISKHDPPSLHKLFRVRGMELWNILNLMEIHVVVRLETAECILECTLEFFSKPIFLTLYILPGEFLFVSCLHFGVPLHIGMRSPLGVNISELVHGIKKIMHCK